MTFGLTKIKNEAPWFNYAIGGRIDPEVEMASSGLVQKAILEKKMVRKGSLAVNLTLEKFSQMLEKKNFHKFYQVTSEDIDTSPDDEEDEDDYYSSPDPFLRKALFYSEDGDSIVLYYAYKTSYEENTIITVVTTNQDILDDLVKELIKYKKKVEKIGKNPVCMVTASRDGFSIRQTGKVGHKFNPKLYSKEVCSGFEYIIKEFKKDIPNGKITILSGPPGTGKTYFIRALIREVGKECSFVVIPPSLVPRLGEPDLLPALLDHKSEKKPMILILEDADILIKERMKDSIDSISAALNMGDGIVGDVCNVRLLITTNQPLTEIDEAMKRPGRLSSLCNFALLNKEEIKVAWEEIAGEKEMPNELLEKEEASLAEIFSFNK